ncbi:MAG: LysR family transcriptional regulator [Polaromonas sp.]|nr:LysR family transcriptional regulator [Gemmatimonadaceae bacterium]
MNTLNFQHLLYFWVVAREGSITRASAVLNLTQPTISTQLKTLERALGATLFERRGRTLVLTDTGQLVLRYADEMFRTGRELAHALARGTGEMPARLVVGVSDALPKLTTWRLLQPALAIVPKFRLICRIDKTERLVADLAAHTLDVVLADAPVSRSSPVRAFNHLLGECGVTIFGAQPLARRYRHGFPQSLDGAPFVLQTENTAVRRSFDAWCIANEISPQVTCEVEDVALLQVFGQEGMGLFMAPTVVEARIRTQYGVGIVGRLPEVRERFYAISVERRLKHPGVVALSDAARKRLFT